MLKLFHRVPPSTKPARFVHEPGWRIQTRWVVSGLMALTLLTRSVSKDESQRRFPSPTFLAHAAGDLVKVSAIGCQAAAEPSSGTNRISPRTTSGVRTNF